MFLLDLHSWQWQQLTMTGTAPSPRQGAAIALQGGTTLLQQPPVTGCNKNVTTCQLCVDPTSLACPQGPSDTSWTVLDSEPKATQSACPCMLQLT